MPRKPKRYSFVQVDVFSTRPLEGNSLAVFTDARGLSATEMQALAREMNLSETTFVFPRPAAVENKRGVRVRIFTTGDELPFAGHPTLGTAAVLRAMRTARRKSARAGKKTDAIVLELGVGPIPVVFSQDSRGKLFGEMRQREPEFGSLHRRDEVAQVAGLVATDIADDPPIQTVSTGVPFTLVPVKTLDAIRKVRLDWNAMTEYSRQHDGTFSFYFVTRETLDRRASAHARMIFSNGEDPATGSAAGCASAWMVRHGAARPEESVLIEQGIEVHRPSRIFVRAGMEGDRVVNVRVGGYTVEVLRGEVRF
jgi:trans-2,3-dihydro-3-hydroxyanthranilate isomerase